MSAIVGGVLQQAANTAYLALGDEIFNRATPGFWKEMTYEVPVDGQYLEMDTLGPSPIVRELVNTARYASLRAYARRERVRVWDTDHLRIPALQVKHDKSGAVTRRLTDYLNASANFYEKPVMDSTSGLLSNPVCIDGVSLLNDTHAYGSAGATWDNLSTAALDPSLFATQVALMANQALENGEPAGFYPSHLLIGAAQEKMGRDLVENPLRPFPMAATGLEAYSSALAPAAIGNWMEGRMQLVISARITGNQWFLMDLKRPGVRPMVIGMADAPQAVVVEDPGARSMIDADAFEYYVRARFAVGGFAPQCIAGSVTA